MNIIEFVHKYFPDIKLYEGQKSLLIKLSETENHVSDGYIAILGRQSGKTFLSYLLVAYRMYLLLFEKITYRYSINVPIHILIFHGCENAARNWQHDFSLLLYGSQFFKHKQFIGQQVPIYDGVLKLSRKLTTVIVESTNDPKKLSLIEEGTNIHKFTKIIDTILFEEFGSLCRKNDQIAGELYKIADSISTNCSIISSASHENDSLHKIFLDNSSSLRAIDKKKIQLPSWEVNNELSFNKLKLDSELSDAAFNYEFGAEFMQKSNLNETLSLRFSSEQISQLKRMARKASFEQDRDISYLDIIRDAVDKAFKDHEDIRPGFSVEKK